MIKKINDKKVDMIEKNRLKVYSKIIYAIFFISMIIYIATLKLRPYPFSCFVKIIPIISLIFATYLNIPGKRSRLIMGALLFSAIGDIILAVDGRSYFVFGLSSFALAHLLYIWAFTVKPVINRKRSIFAVLFVIYGLIMAYILIPELGKMIIPVMVYLTIIICMGISSVIGRDNNYLMILGAFIFMISDSVIAFNMFHTKISFSSFWIMITYFPAQFLIVHGTIKGNKLHKE